jgi:predicted Zn finger-like uncharacterized protein
METTCPQCSQRLRVKDDVKNPLLRCGRCGNMFRLLESTQSSLPPAGDVPPHRTFELSPARFPASDPFARDVARDVAADTTSNVSLPDSYPQVDTSRPKASAPSGPSMKKGGWGSILIVLVVILLKVGPRLARNFHREQPAQPPPMRFNAAEQQNFQRMLQQIERDRAARKKEMQQFDTIPPVEIPPLPPHAPAPELPGSP